MAVTALPVSTQDLSTRAADLSEIQRRSFEERWAAWQARGAAHDRAVRRRVMFAVPIIATFAAVLYILLVR